LYENGTINRNTHQELVQAYHFVMQLRIKHQSMSLESGLEADNAISPDELSQIELKTLKNTFTQIISIQKKLSYDFTGEAL
jgi:CBS domain-containing protein